MIDLKIKTNLKKINDRVWWVEATLVFCLQIKCSDNTQAKIK
jgi:hypothetical protein